MITFAINEQTPGHELSKISDFGVNNNDLKDLTHAEINGMILVTLKMFILTTSAVAVLLTQTKTDIFVKAGSAQVVE